jgi:hypothetical protein
MHAVLVIAFVEPSPLAPVFLSTMLSGAPVVTLASRPGLHVVSFEAADLGAALRPLDHLELREDVASAYLLVGGSGFHVRGNDAGWMTTYPK